MDNIYVHIQCHNIHGIDQHTLHKYFMHLIFVGKRSSTKKILMTKISQSTVHTWNKDRYSEKPSFSSTDSSLCPGGSLVPVDDGGRGTALGQSDASEPTLAQSLPSDANTWLQEINSHYMREELTYAMHKEWNLACSTTYYFKDLAQYRWGLNSFTVYLYKYMYKYTGKSISSVSAESIFIKHIA